MAAPDTTKYQINYKLADGTLINLYATDVKELESGLADLGMVSSLIKSTGADLNGTALAAATAALAAQFAIAPVATPPAPSQVSSSDGSKNCKHGPMTYKTGVSPKGAWQGWMCPTPKGAPDKCDTIWVR